MKRRDFFKIVGTAGATAAVAGCQPTGEKILPLVTPSDQIVLGTPSYFATVCRECPAGCGVLAKNRDGRVIKLEGNPEHPVNHGALCLRGQAGVQALYHPDRFNGPQRRSGDALGPVSWDDALKTVAEGLGKARGAGKGRIALVTQLENGTLAALLDRWTEALGARRRVTYEPYGHEAQRAANRAVFGRDGVPYHAFEEAEVVVSFGADFLETWINNVSYARGFARMHTFRDGRAGTFIHVEPRQSLTASNADEWIRNAPGTEALVALAVLKTLAEDGAVDKRFADAAGGLDVARAAAESGVSVETIKHIAKVLGTAKPALVVGGGASVTGSNAVAVATAVALLNAALGAVGKTVRFGADWAYGHVTPYTDVVALVQAMANGEIDALLLGPGVNPAFTLPGGVKFVDAVKKVGLVVSFSNRPDETTALAHVVLPDTHWLESWGDYTPREGVSGLMQPVMMPIRDARAFGDVMIALGRTALGITEEGKGPFPASMEAAVKGAWEQVAKGNWAAVLQQGGAWRDAPVASVAARPAAVTVEAPRLDGDANGLVLLPYPSFRFYDGRSAGSAWLHEVPDTMTQTSWDAWVEIPAEVARQQGITNGDVVRVTSPLGSLEAPAYVSASLHPKAVAIPIGHRYAPYHVRGGRYVPVNTTTANPLALLPASPEGGGGAAFLSVRVTVAKTGARRPLAITQATHDQDHRELVRHVGLAAAREEALRGKRTEHHLPSMYPPQEYPGYRWGMSIDVDACIGCQACVVACNAENNIPVVGKAQLSYGRQLHWLRIERWAEGEPAHPHNAFLPMLCQHCEVAPCEPVCPVFAAYRTDEGLNGQVYNRCVGTRYCGNNCPYHVRRFNWFSYEFPAPLEVQLNPDVTVRQLGVMEKCTMCIQRIVAGKDHARDQGRAVKDGDIMTACQQTCPTSAITFGNLKDPQSAVARHTHAPRAYEVLDELGTRPSITYLKKVTRGHA